jgi:hypothetical protein
MSLKELQVRLGHSSIVLTANVYAHLLKIDESAAMAEAEKSFLSVA